jgi:hypothetical protein
LIIKLKFQLNFSPHAGINSRLKTTFLNHHLKHGLPNENQTMTRPTLLLCLFLLFHPDIYSQQKKGQELIDSLETAYSSQRSIADTNQLKTLILLSRNYNNISNFDKSVEYGQATLDLATQLGNKKGVANGYHNIAMAQTSKAMYFEALKTTKRQ